MRYRLVGAILIASALDRVARNQPGGDVVEPTPAPASQWVDIGGPVHYVDHGGPDDGPLLVCVHGLGGSLVNWAALAPLLTDTCRVVALDLAGFGRTQGNGRSASVRANRRLLHRFLTEVTGTPVVLVGNSMGGMISALQASQHPETVAALALVDPALPQLRLKVDPVVAAMFAAYAVPGVGAAALARRRRTRTPEESAMELLRLCTVDASRVPAPLLDQHIALTAERRAYANVDAEMLTAARSLLWTLARRKEYAAMLRRIQAPVLLMHGDRDRLVSIGAARAVAAANPTWRFEVAEDVGHVPQLEVPTWTAARLLDWLTKGEAAGAWTQATKRARQAAGGTSCNS
jgi:pimeloyl-ACP methyl ester carboxylesterase